MIRFAAAVIVRAIVELGIVLLVFAGLIFVVAYRTARLFVTPEPDKLDRVAGGLATALGVAAKRSRFGRLDDELFERASSSAEFHVEHDPGAEQAEELEEIDWREQAL